MADNILGFKCSKNRQKWPSVSTFEHPRTDSRRMTSQKTDVIGFATLPLAVVAHCVVAERRVYSIWGITAAVYFQVIKHYIPHGNSVLASVYSICRQSVVQGVA